VAECQEEQRDILNRALPRIDVHLDWLNRLVMAVLGVSVLTVLGVLIKFVLGG
jgi:hypothetical protein